MAATPPTATFANDRFRIASLDVPPAAVQLIPQTGDNIGTQLWSLSGPVSRQTANATKFRVDPYQARKWSDRDEREFTDLAFKKANYQTTAEEEIKFRQMVSARRRDIPQRSAEQILLTAEHDALLLEMREVLQKYHAFRIKLGPDHKVYKALRDSSPSQPS